VDLETTGLAAAHERIVSVSASSEGVEFSSFVNPLKTISSASTRVHGITDTAVRNAAPWSVVGRNFIQWLEGRAPGRALVLVAHNARFDIQFLVAECARANLSLPKLEVADTLPICREAFPKLASHRQAAVYEHLFGIPPLEQHSSLGDVRALVRICENGKVFAALHKSCRPLEAFFARSGKPPLKSGAG
jgi:DNA polymerase III epsilon subunit-like protein